MEQSVHVGVWGGTAQAVREADSFQLRMKGVPSKPAKSTVCGRRGGWQKGTPFLGQLWREALFFPSN